MELNNLLILTIINSGISLIMGFYMLFLQRTSFKYGTGYWASGSLIIGLALLFKSISPTDSYFAVAGSPVFITIGLYLYLAGIWKFKEQKIHKWIIIIIPVLDFIQSIIFFKFFHSYRIQIGLHAFFLIIYCIYAIFEMIKLNSAQKYIKKLFFLNAFSFTIFLVLLLLNVFALILDPTYNPLAVTNTVIVLQIISSFIMIALTFGFLSAVNIRLNLELEDQLKSKTKFLSIIAHDLRGPIGNIMTFLDFLQNETDLDEQDRKKFLKILNTLSQSTFHLLQNLLEWATKSKNINKSDRERIELSQLISNNIDFFKSSTALKSILFEFKEGTQTYISANGNMLETIVRNLVSNAVKFTPNGGTINITSEKVLDTVRLVVSDTGRGIKPETINSLFKFETSKSTAGTDGEVGSGLGLVLCKELVSSNNGVIQIESQLGVGTKVIVEFPFAK
jgi:two-component system sensor histidine kinase/response regulator